jgi:NET1-associated nuclear protein 1 (U3 small nucleolar RNA-associated protein 17)
MPRTDPMTSIGSQSRSSAAPLAIHKLTSTIILPSSHPSSLQTYSPSSSKLISELEISPSNRVSRREDKPIEPAFVQSAVISPSGEWMASLDVRKGDDAFRGEVYLKIWMWDRSTGNWGLNTRIDQPHGLNAVTHTAFSPDSTNLVTTGNDGQTKIWRVRRPRGKEVFGVLGCFFL